MRKKRRPWSWPSASGRLLALDDCLYALQASIPHLTCSSLHRCLQRHGISRLPEVGGDKPAKKKFAKYAIGYFHVDIAEVHPDQTRSTACQFLRRLIEAVPYRIHTILTDNGIQLTNRLEDRWAFKHLFDRICEEHGIKHRLTTVNHPWTNGQVERMNRTIKEATVKRYHYQTHDQLKDHLAQSSTSACVGKRSRNALS